MTEFFNRGAEKDKRRALRNNPTDAERLLWARLNGKRLLGWKFRRQYSVGPYILDFCCPRLRLAIEVDGSVHAKGDAPDYDRERQRYVEAFGFLFLRFTNAQIAGGIDEVIASIEQTARVREAERARS